MDQVVGKWNTGKVDGVLALLDMSRHRSASWTHIENRIALLRQELRERRSPAAAADHSDPFSHVRLLLSASGARDQSSQANMIREAEKQS